MTEGSVALSRTIKVEDEEMEFREQISVEGSEDAIQRLSIGVRQRVLGKEIEQLVGPDLSGLFFYPLEYVLPCLIYG